MKKNIILILLLPIIGILQAQTTACEIAYVKQLAEADRLSIELEGPIVEDLAILAYYKAKYMAEQCHLPTDLCQKGINDVLNRKVYRIVGARETYTEQLAKTYNYELLKGKFDYYTNIDSEIGFVRAIKDGQYYLVDKAGKAYKAAFRTEDLENETTALCLNGPDLRLLQNLVQYKGLKVLILNNNYYNDNFQLSEKTFNAICQLTQLEVLVIRDCKVKVVPEEIGQLTKLIKLDLGNNFVSDLPEGITKLSQLKVLNLISNTLRKDDLEYIGQLTKLVDLDLTGSRVQSFPESFRHLSQLNRFLLDGNSPIKLPDFIKEWKHLKVLSFGCMGGQVIPDFIGDMDSLVSLSVEGYPILNVPNSLTKLHNLKELSLIDDAACAFPLVVNRLTNLTNLEIQIFTLDSIPDSISNLSNLKQLQLICNSYLELRTLPESVCNLTNLTYLGVQRANALPNSIEKLQNLEVLQLMGSSLKTLPDSIGNLSKLRYINLAYNGCYKLPKSIGHLNSLTHLYLHRNHFETLPEEICQLKNLITLDLDRNHLDTLPYHIGRLSNLRYLDLGSNGLQILPYSITQLNNLLILDLSGNRWLYIPEYQPNIINRLPNLEFLQTDDNFVPDPTDGYTLPTLKGLYITELTRLRKNEIDDIRKQYPKCKVVYKY